MRADRSIDLFQTSSSRKDFAKKISVWLMVESSRGNWQLTTFVDGLLLRGYGFGGQPLVEGDVEVEELLLVAVFVGRGVDHFDEELGIFEGVFVELLDVVEEIAGERAVRLDRGGVEAEVVLVRRDFLVHWSVVDG